MIGINHGGGTADSVAVKVAGRADFCGCRNVWCIVVSVLEKQVATYSVPIKHMRIISI